MEYISHRFLALAKSVLQARPIICDIGSRDALEGIFLFRELGAKYLHVFEPNPPAAITCRQNLKDLDSEVVSFNEVAISDEDGHVLFYPVDVNASDNKDIGFSSLLPINPEYTRRRGHIAQRQTNVRALTLDEYFRERPHPDLLWIDVEGAELMVFRGAQNVLRNVSLIHVEVSFRPMQLGKPMFEEVSAYLTPRGFVFDSFTEISPFRGFLYRKHLLPNPPWRLNAIFRKVHS